MKDLPNSGNDPTRPPDRDHERDLRRQKQRLLFRRNQGLGLLILALIFLAYRLARAPHGWIFPEGWWRLW